MSTDHDLLLLAAKAVGLRISNRCTDGGLMVCSDTRRAPHKWNPRDDDGDRLRLARALGISIDFADCCAWKRMPNGELIQEFWGGDFGDEAHAVLRAAAEIGRSTP